MSNRSLVVQPNLTPQTDPLLHSGLLQVQIRGPISTRHFLHAFASGTPPWNSLDLLVSKLLPNHSLPRRICIALAGSIINSCNTFLCNYFLQLRLLLANLQCRADSASKWAQEVAIDGTCE